MPEACNESARDQWDIEHFCSRILGHQGDRQHRARGTFNGLPFELTWYDEEKPTMTWI